MNAAWENLLDATRVLTGADPIKQRLARAFSEHLDKVDATDLPRDTRIVFRDLVEKLTSARPMRGETAVVATIRKMSNEEAETCAQTIVQLLSHCGRAQIPAAELPSGVVPLYPSLAESVPAFVAVSRA